MRKTLVVSALVALCACQPVVSPIPTNVPAVTPSLGSLIEATSSPTPSLTPPPTVTLAPTDTAEETAWAGSPHGLVASAAAAVPCSDCHEQAGGAIVGTQIAWWNSAAQKYEAVADAGTLCRKCHQQPKPASKPADPKAAMHADYACTACHDPHTTSASCTSSSCHAGVRQVNDMPPATPGAGHPHLENGPFCGGASCHPAATAAASRPRSVHGATHMNVTCQACHAAGIVTVGPGADGGPWQPWQPADSAGSTGLKPFFPHAIQLSVDCQRCHSAGNPWGLPAVAGDEFQK